MRFSARLQLLTCLIVYVGCAHAIMVKYGTKGGPIEPPAPEHSLPPQQPYRSPAPVWEERSNDAPDPNVQWRPQQFRPQPRYTQVVYNVPASPQPLNNAQQFVNAYIPTYQPKKAEPITNYFTPSQILSSQSLPGVGLRYFVPTYNVNNGQQKKELVKQEDAVNNEIDSNSVDNVSRESSSDLQWKFEKDISKRIARTTQEAVAVPIYQWPTIVRHQ